MPFFEYVQNNSGGFFDEDSNVDWYVIVEAANAGEANVLAQEVGIYFDGCDKGMDCPCCGDRWSEVWGEGDEVPSLYGEPVDLGDSDRGIIIHYLDGRRVKV